VPARDIAVDRSRVAAIAARARAAGRTKLSEVEALEVLAAYGIPVAPARLARTADEAARAAAEIGFPVVLKIVSPQIIHKTDVGGVRPNVDSITELKMACAEMLDTVRQRAPAATIDGILVQRMIDGGRETIVGSLAASFGPRDVRPGRRIGGGDPRRVLHRADTAPRRLTCCGPSAVSRSWTDPRRSAVDFAALADVLLGVAAAGRAEIAELTSIRCSPCLTAWSPSRRVLGGMRMGMTEGWIPGTRCPRTRSSAASTAGVRG
jgi:hypothetical protein